MKKAAEAAGVKTKGSLGRPVGGERYARASRLVRHRVELGDAVVGKPVSVEHAPRLLEAEDFERVPGGRKSGAVPDAFTLGPCNPQPLRAAHGKL